MNRIEFMELQERFANIAYNYDKACKEGFMLDAKYTFNFEKYVLKRYTLSEENKMIQSVCKLLLDKKSTQEIDDYILNYKNGFSNAIASFQKRALELKNIVLATEKMSVEELNEIEELYNDYCHKYHPAIKMSVDSKTNNFHQMLNRFYTQNNLGGMKELMSLYNNLLVISEVKEKDYNQFAEYFYDAEKRIESDLSIRFSNYPYTIADIFTDKTSIASEEGNIRAMISKIQELNSNLHKDLVNLYGEDISLGE